MSSNCAYTHLMTSTTVASRERTASTSRIATLLQGGGAIAVTMVIANGAFYVLTMVSARLLGPAEYSALAAAMNMLMVVSVLSLGVQATAARRIALVPARAAEIQTSVLHLSWRTGIAIGAALALLAPLTQSLLRLDSLAPALWLAAAAVPATVIGGYIGILQGERRWRDLSLLYLAAALRLPVGIALLWWRPDVVTALVAVTLAGFLPILVGRHALRAARTGGVDAPCSSMRALVAETARNSQALLAFMALSNVDVIVARAVLDPHEAGLYAAGAILAKTCAILPQFVVVVAFPALASPDERARALNRGLVITACLGLVATAGVVVLRPVALSLVGGAEFAEIAAALPWFTLLGTGLAMVQLVVYAVLARQGRRSALLIWAAAAALVAGGWSATTAEGLLVWGLAVSVILLALLVGTSYWILRRSPLVTDPVPVTS